MIGNIYINGAIGHWEGEPSVILTDIVKQVQGQPEATSFNVYINSEGGYVDVGFDIFNYLRSLGKPITTIGNGIVASIATVIFMAGTTRQVKDGTQFMVHLPWGEAIGTAEEVEKYAKELRQTEKQLLDFYTKELGISEEAIQPLIRDETWLTVDQLQTLGFTTAQPAKVAAKARINLKNDNKMTNEDKNWFKELFSDFAAMLKPKGKAKNKMVQDATGAELDFADLADDAPIEVGASATVDGAPAEGEYIMPDGTIYNFTAGVLEEIVPPATDDLAAANERIAELEAELAAKNTELADKVAEHSEQLDTINKEFNKIKAQVKSKLNLDTTKPPANQKPAGDDDQTSRYSQAVAKAKSKNK